jgi:hypothetical protein
MKRAQTGITEGHDERKMYSHVLFLVRKVHHVGEVWNPTKGPQTP